MAIGVGELGQTGKAGRFKLWQKHTRIAAIHTEYAGMSSDKVNEFDI